MQDLHPSCQNSHYLTSIAIIWKQRMTFVNNCNIKETRGFWKRPKNLSCWRTCILLNNWYIIEIASRGIDISSFQDSIATYLNWWYSPETLRPYRGPSPITFPIWFKNFVIKNCILYIRHFCWISNHLSQFPMTIPKFQI